MEKGLFKFLHERKKAPWPTFPLRIILYELNIHKAKSVEIKELDRLHIVVKEFHGYDPSRVCRQNYERNGFNWGYSSMSTTEDEKVKN